MKYYVYKLIDPRTSLPFYIGKGQGDRMYAHEKEAIKGIHSRKCETIRSILAEGLKVQYEIASRHKDEQEAYDCEAALIESIGLENLTNVVPGGGGVLPPRVKAASWSEDRKMVKDLAIFFKRTAMGYATVIFGVDVMKIAHTCMGRLLERYSFDKVEAEFKRFNVEIAYGSAQGK